MKGMVLKMGKKLGAFFLSLALTLALFSGCTPIKDEETSSASITSAGSTAADSKTEEPAKEPATIKLTAAGDNLIHSSIYKQANRLAGGNGYDFSYVYEHVKHLINGDINILNQETLLASPPFEPSNYPMFSSPTEVGDTMIGMGFNVFTLANNHMLDKGTKGIEASLDYWGKQKNILTSGQYRNQQELEKVRTITKKDITAGLISVTEHTNGLSLPKDSVYKILYSTDEAAIEKQIKATKKESDFVIVAIHWGVENSHIVSEQQKALAQKMADWGADLIIGTHPHVLQGMEWLTRTDGGRTLVAYSIGNFVSAMEPARCMLGGLLDLEITKDYGTKKTTITKAKLVPVVTQVESGYTNVRAYPLAEYTEELAKKHRSKGFGLSYAKNLLAEMIDSEFLPEA